MEARAKFLVVGIIAIIAAFGLLLILSGGKFVAKNGAISEKGYFNFVKCLEERGFVLYGTDGNQFVEMQLDLFMNAKGNVTYIDCSKDMQDCSGIIIYPSWKTPEGILSGGFSLEILSAVSGCELR